jgi:hypothetical protein
MNKKLVCAVSVVILMSAAVVCPASRKRSSDAVDQPEASAVSKAIPAGALLVADFSSDQPVNAFGGQFGAWEKDPADPTQKCTMTLVKPGYNSNGKAVKLAYSVDSPNPAYNGFWMKLQDKNVSAFSKLVLKMKGDAKAGIPNNFKVELKNAKNTYPCYVSGITSEWTSIEIPFTKFEGMKDLSGMTELTIVFEDGQTAPKRGALYVGEIYFAK